MGGIGDALKCFDLDATPLARGDYMIRETLNERRAGSILGLALGDALGIPYENQDRPQVSGVAMDTLLKLKRTERNNGETFEVGEGSDDTAQVIAFMHTYPYPGVSPWVFADWSLAYAKALHQWLESGGKGSGGYIRKVIRHPLFLADPTHAASVTWDRARLEGTGAPPVGNGGLMRCAPAALFFPDDAELRSLLAVTCSAVTHAFPKSLACSLVFTHTLAAALNELPNPIQRGLHAAYDTPETPFYPLEGIQKEVRQFWAHRLISGDAELKGLDVHPYSHVFHSLTAALWALDRMTKGLAGFEETLADVIYAGGDTNTNAALAGALMGAHLGIGSLPDAIEDLQVYPGVVRYFGVRP